MISARTALTGVIVVGLTAACRPADDAGSVAFAGFAAPGSAPVEESWQSTVTRRVRWGPGIDNMARPFPDGERMAVIDWGTGDVGVYTLATGETEHLTHQPTPYAEGAAMFPVVAADGRRIAYSWQDYQEDLREIQLRVVDTEGGAPELLYLGPSAWWIQATDWSRDGSRLLVVRMADDGTNQIAIVSAGEGTATVLKQLGPRYPADVRFSPDGRFVAYDYPTTALSDSHDIWVLAADGGNEAALVRHEADDRLLGWTPDGRAVLFLSDRAGTPGAWLLPVTDGRAAGEPYLVKPDMWNTTSLGFDRNGRYFYGVGVGARALYEATFSADGRSLVGEPRDLSTRTHRDVQAPRWSPNGAYVAFVVYRQGRPPGIFIRSLETGEEQEVSLDRRLEYFYDLEWLPDGSSLLAVVIDEQQRHPLVRIDVRTGETATLLQPENGEQISGLTVTPDGRTLYLTRRLYGDTPADGREQVVAYDMATAARRVIYEGDPTRRIRGLTISPEGRTLAFVHGARPAEVTISVLPLDADAPRAVAEGDGVVSLAWAPDGRALLLTRAVDPSSLTVGSVMRLERLELATGAVASLGLEREGLGLGAPMSFHPDGRRAVFTAGTPESEWWVMEGFVGTPPPRGEGARGGR